MATARKKTSSKKTTAQKTSAAKKSTATKKKTSTKAKAKTTTKKSTAKTAAKKRAPKKTTAKKKTTKKTTAAARKKATTTKRVRKVATTPKKEMKPKTKSWWSVLTFGVIAVGLGVAGFLSLNPEMAQQFQANIIAQFNGLVQEDGMSGEENEQTSEGATPTVTAATTMDGGVLISWKDEGENESKLKEIFETVFPETTLEMVNYKSEKGQELISKWGVTEVPSVYYAQQSFDQEPLAEVVKDLFTLDDGYYALQVALVNPSGQLHINSELNTDGAIEIGQDNAPLEVVVYSDPKCQHCRVNEQNNMESFQALAEEGIVKLIYMDVPQNSESHYHSAAMTCVGQTKPEVYMDYRQQLFTRPNIAEAYTDRLLQQYEVAPESDCDMDTIKQTLRLRVREVDADGITGVPAVYIRKAGEVEAIRVTGAKNFSEYEAIFDELMGKATAAEMQDTEA